jgi:hypothetical protein
LLPVPQVQLRNSFELLREEPEDVVHAGEKHIRPPGPSGDTPAAQRTKAVAPQGLYAHPNARGTSSSTRGGRGGRGGGAGSHGSGHRVTSRNTSITVQRTNRAGSPGGGIPPPPPGAPPLPDAAPPPPHVEVPARIHGPPPPPPPPRHGVPPLGSDTGEDPLGVQGTGSPSS